MISAQGYSVNLPDWKPELDSNMHVKVADKGYAYAQLAPGKHRIVSLMDFGVHDEAFIDEDRVKLLRKNYENDFKFEKTEGPDADWKDLRSCLRPQSTDDLPIVGAMTHHPNVLLNIGHGGHGLSISFSCAKIIQEMI